MIITVLRTFAAVIAGLVVCILLLVAVEAFSAVVHPFPPDTKQTHEEICRHVEHYPTWVLAVCVPLWGFAAFASSWTAGKIGNVYSYAIVGVLVFIALAGNLVMLPYPLWFRTVMATMILFAIVAARPAKRVDLEPAGQGVRGK